MATTLTLGLFVGSVLGFGLLQDKPAVTTYRYKNHAVRSAGWRYIRYANGDEELYDETKDPNEYTNLAAKPEFDAMKSELARFLPAKDAAETEPPSSSQKKAGKKNKKAE